jgi:hypothetical protein
MLYIGFSMQHGAKGEYEQFRFAMHDQSPPFAQKNGNKLTKPQDAFDFGFKVVVLLETSFAFNARRLETMLQTQFWEHPNRLWRARGAGSYFVSERHLKVRCCCCC